MSVTQCRSTQNNKLVFDLRYPHPRLGEINRHFEYQLITARLTNLTKFIEKTPTFKTLN